MYVIPGTGREHDRVQSLNGMAQHVLLKVVHLSDFTERERDRNGSKLPQSPPADPETAVGAGRGEIPAKSEIVGAGMIRGESTCSPGNGQGSPFGAWAASSRRPETCPSNCNTSRLTTTAPRPCNICLRGRRRRGAASAGSTTPL